MTSTIQISRQSFDTMASTETQKLKQDAKSTTGASQSTSDAWRSTVHQRRLESPLYYGDYLGLDKVLTAQHPVTRSIGNEAHDETLFIIIH